MHLISDGAQTVHLGGREFHFAPGEKIITEFSYKHTMEGFTRLAASAGFQLPASGPIPGTAVRRFSFHDVQRQLISPATLRLTQPLTLHGSAGQIASASARSYGAATALHPTDLDFRARQNHRAHRSERLRQIDSAAADHRLAPAG